MTSDLKRSLLNCTARTLSAAGLSKHSADFDDNRGCRVSERIKKLTGFLTVAAKHCRKAEYFLQACRSAAEVPCNGRAGIFKQPDRLVTMVLWLTALHSISIGLALIVQPADLMKIVGFDQPSERFFPTQGGVFHILMAVAYLMGSADIEKYYSIIVFSIIVKAAATFFLMVYCFTVDFKWIILLSGIVDLIMGLSIFAALQRYLCFQKYHRNRATYE